MLNAGAYRIRSFFQTLQLFHLELLVSFIESSVINVWFDTSNILSSNFRMTFCNNGFTWKVYLLMLALCFSYILPEQCVCVGLGSRGGTSLWVGEGDPSSIVGLYILCLYSGSHYGKKTPSWSVYVYIPHLLSP